MGRKGYYDEWYRYEPSTPRAVKGGIKAQSQRGSFASEWWGKRWIKVLEGFGIGARLGRGRSYARRGQVIDLQIGPGEVRAAVQGSRATPYRVTIGLKTLSEKQWATIAAAIVERPIIAARLLAGQMPEDIEAIIRDTGVTLFPDRKKDLVTECSCPDWSNPCKHIAAVHYLLAEAFDRDPFLLLRLRGLERDAFIRLLSSVSGDSDAAQSSEAKEFNREPEPLPISQDRFWGRRIGEGPVNNAISGTSAALIRRLGPVPFWRGREEFMTAMATIYESASMVGEMICTSEGIHPHPGADED